MTEPRPADAPLAVAMRGIVKRFPGLIANDHVDFDLRPGEVHALLGENGAGKSTLMNILAGLSTSRMRATIEIDGVPTSLTSPRDAIAAGLGMIHQHFMLVPSLTVTENILLGLHEPRFRLRLPRYGERIRELGEQTGLPVDPDARVWQLSVGEQQRVEILKMLYRGARVLIMDEPTAVLAPQETEELFRTLRQMASRGQSIVFISHKLDEVVAIADRVTVLRRGRVTAAGIPAAGQTRASAGPADGRPGGCSRSSTRRPWSRGPVVLRLEDVSARNDRGLPALRDVALDGPRGRDRGHRGRGRQWPVGAGRGGHRAARLHRADRRGRRRMSPTSPPLRAIASGVAHVPEDRHGTGSAPGPVAHRQPHHEELSPGAHRPSLAPGPARGPRSRRPTLTAEYQGRAPTIDTQARLLSGGNLQRLIFAREITTEPRLLVAVQPTRGLDVGAVETVHRLLLERRAAGAAILLISEDLDEILALADRVAVIYDGRITGVVEAADRRHPRAGAADDRGRTEPRRPSRPCRVSAQAPASSDWAIPLSHPPRASTGDAALAAGRHHAGRGGRRAAHLRSAHRAHRRPTPSTSFQHILGSAVGRVGVLSDTLVKATPLIFTGLACALAFRMRLWNIGAEGQLLWARGARRRCVLLPLRARRHPAFIVVPLDDRRGLSRRVPCGAASPAG